MEKGKQLLEEAERTLDWFSKIRLRIGELNYRMMEKSLMRHWGKKLSTKYTRKEIERIIDLIKTIQSTN